MNLISGGDVARLDQLEHEPCDLRVLLEGLPKVGHKKPLFHRLSPCISNMGA